MVGVALGLLTVGRALAVVAPSVLGELIAGFSAGAPGAGFSDGAAFVIRVTLGCADPAVDEEFSPGRAEASGEAATRPPIPKLSFEWRVSVMVRELLGSTFRMVRASAPQSVGPGEFNIPVDPVSSAL